MSTQVLSVRTCFAVYFALLALTAVTVGAAFLDLLYFSTPIALGIACTQALLVLLYFSTPIALGIACTKALLVLLYFMELRHSPKLTWIILGNGVFWLMVMISL